MPLFEIVVSALGPAIAKTVLKVWAGDNKAISEGSGSAIEVLTKLIPEIRARNEAKRQLESIGERAAESLMFTFESEGKLLMVEDQEAVVSLVAQTLDRNNINAEILVRKDLDPVSLAQYFISGASEQLSNLPERRVQLFTRVIEEASQSIIDIARVLPNLTERTFSELLKQNRVLVDAAQQILERLDRIRTKADDDQEIEAARFETEYRRAVVRNLNKVDLFGIELSRASRSHSLSVAYVSLDVGSIKEVTNTEDRPDKDETEENDEAKVDVVEAALAEANRLIIRGPAGAGKTTLIHWIAVQASSRSFEDPLEAWNGLIPFIIRLRQFSDSALPSPEQFPSLVSLSISDTMPRGWVHRVLQVGTAIVMVDGVDEVTESRRVEVRTWLKDIVDTFPKCRFIVTSRPHAVEQRWLDTEGFLDADLQPMDMAGIEAFIDHWHMAVREEMQREEEVESLDRLAQNLKLTLRGNLAVRRLATNPLLCSVICALHRDTNEQLPDDRLDLYERCCSMLLERRDPESGLKLQGYPRLSYRQKRFLLDDLAYWMIKNDWSEISLSPAHDRLHKRIEALRPDDREGVLLTGESSLRFFLERSGILREPLRGKLDFAHRTFQEFMAASAAIKEGDIGVLLSNATNSQWREVVVLGAGLARPSERGELIKSLIRKGDGDRATSPQLYLLAAACLETSVDIDNALRSEVERRISKLFPPASISDAMQLAEAAGEMALPFLKRKKYLNSKEAAACVRALAMIGTREAVQAIAEYTRDYGGSVLKEVVRASDRIDPSMYLELVGPHLDINSLSGDSVAHLMFKFGVDGVINLRQARELSLSGGSARDLGVLRRFTNLHSLRLSGAGVKDLDPILHLKKLEYLILDRVATGDFSVLRRLPKLRSLTINRCAVDALQLADISGIGLLSFSGAEIRNAEALSNVRSLHYLQMYDTKVKLAFLKDLAMLTRLTLSHIDENDLSDLSSAKNLKSLTIIGGELGDLHWLLPLTTLEDLDLYSVRIAASAKFPRLPLLHKLSLKGPQIKSRIGVPSTSDVSWSKDGNLA
jgi:hypothetical protein